MRMMTMCMRKGEEGVGDHGFLVTERLSEHGGIGTSEIVLSGS